jgi:hypothetical protein
MHKINPEALAYTPIHSFTQENQEGERKSKTEKRREN